MVVWVIGRNYPTTENGMMGSFELEQAKMLSRHGNDVTYLACSLHPTKRINGSGLQSWEDEGVNVSVLSAFFPPRVFPLYCIKQRNRQWIRLFEETEKRSGMPDVIHVHYPAMLMIADALKAYHERGVRIVATEHWSKVLAKELNSIELKEFGKYKAILNTFLCVGSPLKDSVNELTGMQCTVVPNTVNEMFQPSETKHEGFRFVAVGRLVKVKQFDQIIQAFCECFLTDKNITLMIIGGGKEKETLQKLIKRKKAEDQVKLIGSQSRKTTAELVANSDCLVCFSRFETFGVPVIEAWACGVPVITTTAAAVVDYCDERLGVKVSFDDYERLKESLRFVYAHRDDFDREFIGNYAKMHFSEEVVCDRLMQIYSE